MIYYVNRCKNGDTYFFLNRAVNKGKLIQIDRQMFVTTNDTDKIEQIRRLCADPNRIRRLISRFNIYAYTIKNGSEERRGQLKRRTERGGKENLKGRLKDSKDLEVVDETLTRYLIDTCIACIRIKQYMQLFDRF